MPFRRLLALLPVAAIFLLSTGCASASPGGCDLYASPVGSDSASGTAAAPLRSVSRLAQVLRPGQVGCLRAGAYQGEGESYKELKISTSDITIASAPGETAEIDARIWIAEGADGVSFERLLLDGANTSNLPSPTVNADDATFREDDVTNSHTTICFDLGNVSWGRAVGTLIEDSIVHGCGEEPSTNTEHGIYLSDAEDTVIRGNWIYDNVDRGIQLYPDAQGTVITENVIYGNGEGIIFSGNEEVAASGSTVTHNLIGASQIRRNVESFYPEGAPHGTDNEVTENCIFGASTAYYAGGNGSGIQEPQVGFSASDNVIAAPQFVNAAAGNFELSGGSSCVAVMGAAATATPGPPGAPLAEPGEIVPPVTITIPPVTISTPPITLSTSRAAGSTSAEGGAAATAAATAKSIAAAAADREKAKKKDRRRAGRAGALQERTASSRRARRLRARAAHHGGAARLRRARG